MLRENNRESLNYNSVFSSVNGDHPSACYKHEIVMKITWLTICEGLKLQFIPSFILMILHFFKGEHSKLYKASDLTEHGTALPGREKWGKQNQKDSRVILLTWGRWGKRRDSELVQSQYPYSWSRDSDILAILILWYSDISTGILDDSNTKCKWK